MIELFWARGAGSDLLPEDTDDEVEYWGDYTDVDAAVAAVVAADFRGRGFLSSPDRGRYTHRIVRDERGVRVAEI